jgi:hypothetical protein
VTVGPVAKFAISRLLLGMTTVIWFALVSVITIPQAWLQVRQVHLRKEDGGTVGSLRPIAVASIFLRLVSSSWTPQGSGMDCVSGLRAVP